MRLPSITLEKSRSDDVSMRTVTAFSVLKTTAFFLDTPSRTNSMTSVPVPPAVLGRSSTCGLLRLRSILSPDSKEPPRSELSSSVWSLSMT